MIRSKITMTFLWALLTLALHVLPGTVAPAQAQGSRKDDIVFNSRGIPLAGATVRVCAMPATGQPCTPLALIYSDPALTQALANPTTTDGLGNYFFYAAPGKYEIEISGPQITTKQIPNVILPNDPASPTFSGAVSAFSLSLSGNLTVNGSTTVVGNLASGTLNLSNQGTPPGAAGSGTVNLYTKTADKRLYYKDDTGTETGPLLPGAATNVTNTFTAGQNFDGDTHFKGLNPWIDVTRYGARAVNPNATPAAVGLTANCNSVTNPNQVTISSASTFQNGDGVIVYGCGAPQSMSTPTGLTVTPSVASSATGVGGLGYTVSAPSGGATTYNYQIIARDKNGGLTAASTVGTTSTGSSSLGTQSVSITSLSRGSSAVVTVVTASAHGLSAGSMVRIAGVNADFNGWQTVATVPDSTHFTFTNGIVTVETATGGTVTWWNCNHLSWTAVTGAWEYYIYGRTGSSLTLLGVSKPNIGPYVDLTWDDYGSPMMDGVVLPPYVPTTPPSSATSDHLSTTILSGAGTTTLTLNANAGTSVTGTTIRFDNAPAIVAAAAAANFAAPLYIPASTAANGSFVVNSFLDLSADAGLSIVQVGSLYLNETIRLAAAARWYGDRIPGGSSLPQFGFQNNAPIAVNTANPGIYFPMQGGLMQGLQINGTGNASQLVVVDGGNQVSVSDVGFSNGGGSGDYMGIGLNIRSAGFGNNAFGIHLNRLVLIAATQSNVTATPIMVCDRCGTTYMREMQFSGRGTFWTVQEGGGQIVNLDWGYIQGTGSTPLFMVSPRGSPGGVYYLKNVWLDTDAGALFSSIATAQGNALTCAACGTPVGTGDAQLTGNPLASYVSDASPTGQNTNVSIVQGGSITTTSATGGQGMKSGIQVGGVLGMGYAFPQPAAPTVVVGAHSSCLTSCVAPGTYFYYVAASDANGGSSLQSPSSAAATTDGTQTITVSWTLLNGQVLTQRGRATAATGGTFADNSGAGVAGTSYSDLSTIAYFNSAPTPISGFSEGLSSKGFAGHQALLADPNSSFTSTVKPTTLTANRPQTLPDNTGYIPVTSYVNSAYDNANRSNGAIGTNWTVTNNGISISSNNFVGASASNDVSYWSANPFSSVQFSQVTLTALNGTTDFPGVAVLLSGSGGSTHGYNCIEDTTNIFIQKIVGTSNATLTSALTAGAAGDILRLEVDAAGNLTCYKNGVSALTVNDTTYTSGSPGLFLFGTVATAKNWSGGNLRPLAQLDSEQDWTKTQHFTQGLALGGASSESFNNNPRAEQNVFLPGALTSTWTGATWTNDKAVTITRVQVQAKTAPSGCSTNAVVRLTDGTSPVNITISGAANDSGAISQNYAAGSSLTVAVQTAAAGCTTSPADANVVVQYRMQ